jgi:hypothetical protein
MISLVVAFSLFLADPPAQAAKEPKLRDELLARMKEEQEARFAAIKARAIGKKEPGKDDPKGGPGSAAWKKVEELDAANREWLKGVIAKHGWPGKSLVGEDGTHAVWLLVQHADNDRPFQKKCLELMKEAVKAGESPGSDLAYLTDRVLVGEGKDQLYGTQLTQKDGKLVPQPIEDAPQVDARRKAVGLPPLAEYLELATKIMRSGGTEKPAIEKP